MNTSEKSIKTRVPAIVLFYAIAIALRYITNKTGLLHQPDSSLLKICLQGLGPALGGLIALRTFGLKTTYSLTGKLKPLLLSLLVFVVVPMLGFALTGIQQSEQINITSNTYLAGAKLCFYFMLYAILEETGWRAFLHDQLGFLNQYLKYAIIGMLWFVWHLNFEMSSSNLLFLLILILASWGIGKIGDKTSSILAVAAFHNLYNLMSVNYFDTQAKIVVLAISVTIWILYLAFYSRLARLLTRKPQQSQS